MKTVFISDAKNHLNSAREVEEGETIVVTRNGRPVLDLVPRQARKGLRLEAIEKLKRKDRIKSIVSRWSRRECRSSTLKQRRKFEAL